MADFSWFDPGTWFGGEGWWGGSSAPSTTSATSGGSEPSNFSMNLSDLTMPRQVESSSIKAPLYDFTSNFNSPSSSDVQSLANLFSSDFGTDKNFDNQSFLSPGSQPEVPVDKPTSSGGILSALGLSDVPTADLLKAGIAGGGLLYNMFGDSPTAALQKKLGGLADQQTEQGRVLQSYLTEGKLPPGAQQWVDNQVQRQKTAIRSKYASLGMSGSTAEMQELNQVEQDATSQMFKMASALMDTGIRQTGASIPLYNYLINAKNADNAAMSNAINNFVASLSSGGSSKKAAVR